MKTRLSKLNVLVAGLLVLPLAMPAQAQSDRTRCPRESQASQSDYRFRMGTSTRFEYPVHTEEDRFPEFRHLERENDRNFGRSYRSPGTIGRIRTRGDQYQDNYRSRQLRSRMGNDDREYGRRQLPRDYRYSGYDYESGRNRYERPRDDRYRFDLTRDRNLRDFRNLRDGGFDDYRSRTRQSDYRYQPDRDTPSPDRRQPVPARRPAPNQDELVSARYSNQANVRFARSLSADQGLRLFREVSQLIDRRHLSPKSYGERLRNGADSLTTAIRNHKFRAAMSFNASADVTRDFEYRLRQLVNRDVRSSGDAEQVIRAAMQLGQSVRLSPGVVAYEFANGAIASHDKYSAFEPIRHRVSGSIDEIRTQTASVLEDEYVTGVGVEVREHKDGLEIVRALRGGPAVEAGILSGDVIREINGRSIAGMKMSSSVALIGGGSGSSIEFLIAREGRGTKRFRLARRRFRVYTVNDVRMLNRENGVGYLHLNKFAKSSATEMEQALQELRSQGMKSMVIDVRGNPGGLLTTAVEVCDKFLRCGNIVSTRGRLSSDNMLETANAGNTWSMPLVVLTDGDSASASEIFAAAIQENGRGVVVGETTYGKGTVQTHFPLASGMGTLRLTTARFYSPNNRPMAGSGVTPNVETTDRETLARAAQIASHPRLAEMVADHGTCRPRSSSNFGSADFAQMSRFRN